MSKTPVKGSRTFIRLFLPAMRTGLRFKITLPYILLSALLTIAGAFVITRLIVDSVQERFTNQLLETGRLAANRMVEIEQQNLEMLRSLAHSDEIIQAVRDRDSERLRTLVHPVATNARADLVDLLDRNGKALLSLRHSRDGGAADYESVQGSTIYAAWPFVQQVLNGIQDEGGDKFAGLVTDAPWGASFHIAGPIMDGDELIGVVMVGVYMDHLAADLRTSAGAHYLSIYIEGGELLLTTASGTEDSALEITPEEYAQILNRPQFTRVNAVELNGEQYSQAFLPFEARYGSDLGVLAIGLSQGYLVRASPVSRIGLTLMLIGALGGVIVIGSAIARHITRPILAIAQASRLVAQGDLNQQVDVHTQDEVGELAHAFNEMVARLRLGEAVRDLFGRAVSPEVSNALIEAVSTGQIRLGGETRQVTILFSDMKGFTAFSEQHTASQVVTMLNELFSVTYPAIVRYGGVINKYGGDSTMALFGAPIPQPDHARRAVLTALAMQDAVAELNARRRIKKQPPIQIGIGINTGEVVVGTIGAAERLEYTVIGDPVNVAARIEGLTRQFESHEILISQATLDALGPDHGFIIKDLGAFQVKGKSAMVHIYSVLGRRPDA